jgi:hypothetical protein
MLNYQRIIKANPQGLCTSFPGFQLFHLANMFWKAGIIGFRVAFPLEFKASSCEPFRCPHFFLGISRVYPTCHWVISYIFHPNNTMDPVVHSHLRSGATGLSLAASLDVFLSKVYLSLRTELLSALHSSQRITKIYLTLW